MHDNRKVHSNIEIIEVCVSFHQMNNGSTGTGHPVLLGTPGSQHWRVRWVKRGRRTVPGRSQATCKRLRQKGPWRVAWAEEEPEHEGWVDGPSLSWETLPES